jgi:membrane-bound serine protease (ClpP class)
LASFLNLYYNDRASPIVLPVDPNVLGRTDPEPRPRTGVAAGGITDMRANLNCYLSLVSAVLLGLVLVQPSAAQDAPQADGIFVTVQNPITAGQNTHIQATIDSARRASGKNIKTIVFDFNPDGKDSATDKFGECYELAKYIRNLRDNGIHTVAFVHAKTTRHTVLPVIACEDLVMSSGGQIGEVWSKERPVEKTEQDYYQQLAGISRAGPVMKMIDKDVKLVQSKLPGGSVIFVDQRKVVGPNPDPAYGTVINPNPVPMSAGVELYNVEQAQKFKLCGFQAEDRNEVKDRYKLPDTSLAGDPLAGRAVKPVRIVVEGIIDTAMREKVARQVKVARSRNENTFFFVIETTGGGDASAATSLADDIIELGKNQCRTIAFIPGKAPDLAIFLAFACQEIVMYKGAGQDEAVLGDFETYLGGPNNRRVNAEFVRRNLESIAEQTGRSKLVVEGMFEKDLEIVRARNEKTGDRQLMTAAELKGQADKGWILEKSLKQKGVLLKLDATKAKEDFRIAKTINNKDISEVYALYGVEAKDVRSSEPSWLDDFAAFLRQTPVSILLVIVGIAGLVLELKAPGLIVPGVIAAICFVLFFWAQTQLGGQLIYLAIMLFLLGLALLGIEIFLLPGFGVAGVSGILLVLAGLVLAGLDKAPESTEDWVTLVGRMLRYGLTMAGAGVLAFILSRYLPKIPYANRLMLVPPEDKADGDELSPVAEAAMSLLGQVGTATSMLRPSGMAKFGDRYVDVVTEGDFIAPGTPLQVVEVEGTRIVVKKV